MTTYTYGRVPQSTMLATHYWTVIFTCEFSKDSLWILVHRPTKCERLYLWLISRMDSINQLHIAWALTVLIATWRTGSVKPHWEGVCLILVCNLHVGLTVNRLITYFELGVLLNAPSRLISSFYLVCANRQFAGLHWTCWTEVVLYQLLRMHT